MPIVWLMLESKTLIKFNLLIRICLWIIKSSLGKEFLTLVHKSSVEFIDFLLQSCNFTLRFNSHVFKEIIHEHIKSILNWRFANLTRLKMFMENNSNEIQSPAWNSTIRMKVNQREMLEELWKHSKGQKPQNSYPTFPISLTSSQLSLFDSRKFIQNNKKCWLGSSL